MQDFISHLTSWAPALATGVEYTLLLTLTGMTLALIVAIPLAALRSMKGLPVLRGIASFYVEIIRGTPLLLQLFYIYFVLPQMGIRLSPLVAGSIALGINYSAYLSEVFRGGIAAVEKSQWEAAQTLGLSGRFTWTHIILPQALRISIPSTGNYVVSMFKDTALCSTITVTELLFTGQLIGQQSFQYLQIYTVVFVIYLIITYPASRGVAWIERRTRIEAR